MMTVSLNQIKHTRAHNSVPEEHHSHSSSLLSTGKCLSEGAECSPAGDFHVQRAEETRLWGRFQMVIAVHRLTCRCQALPEGF